VPFFIRDIRDIDSRRRVFQLVLGVIWLLDAGLQLQPYMFTKAFVRDVILSTAPGNPAIVARPIIWVANLMLGHIVIVNAAFATLQLLLAIGLFCRPTVRLALAASIAWSVAVWWLGEGFGGVLTGSVDPFGGAPGAVVLYVVVALLVWPRQQDEPQACRVSVAETGPLAEIGARVLWTVLWAGLGCASLLPATRSADSLSQTLAGLRDGEPGWIRSVDRALSHAVAGQGALAAVLFASLCGAAAATVAFGRFTRLGVIAAIVAGVAIWVAQDFGELLTGQATDPNSGPLLIVLAAAFWPVAGWPGTSESTVAGGLRSQRTKYGRAGPPVLSNRIAHDTN
jgi:hypothetical protein